MEQNETIKLVNPVEGENTHIEAHKAINKYMTQFNKRINDLDDCVKKLGVSIRDVDGDFSSAFSEIKKDIKELKEIIGTTVAEIKNLKTKPKVENKYLVKNYEGILDTDTEVVIDLEEIELVGDYLVNVVPSEVIPNGGTEMYSLPQTSIASNSYTPHVYLMAKKGEHAVLEYDFNVILTKL